MTTAKPRYAGDGTGDKLDDFSDELRSALRKFFPDKDAFDNSIFGHPADAFVAHVLAEAWWAKSELHWQGFEGTKAELRAERDDLLKRVRELEVKLRSISSDLDRLLGINADPLGCADNLSDLAKSIELAEAAINHLPKAKRTDQKQRWVAVELAIRVLRVLKEYGIRPSATGDSYFGYTSHAVEILKLIGKDIRLVRDELTWRDIIIEAKTATPDLQ